MNAILKAAAGVLLGVSCLAQNTVPSESKFFKLEFTVKDVESGKLVSSRKYVTTIDTFASSQTSVRSGDKVPVHTGGNTSQFSYIDLSVNIDCNKARETPAGLSLYVSSDVTSSPVSEGSTAPQVIRTNRWNATVMVPLRKSTIVFSSDDPATNHVMQLELLATPL